MDDLIHRQTAIDVLKMGEEFLNRALDYTDIVGAEREKYEWGLGLIESYVSDMKELPSVQPLTAYVISDEDGNIKCSNCGSFECWGNYCMNCGAKMRR